MVIVARANIRTSLRAAAAPASPPAPAAPSILLYRDQASGRWYAQAGDQIKTFGSDQQALAWLISLLPGSSFLCGLLEASRAMGPSVGM